MGWGWLEAGRGLAGGVFCCLNLWGLRIVSGVAFTPLGGCLGALQRAQGGLLCPMLSRVATVRQENPCRAGPAYLCLRQLLRPGQGHQLARVGLGGAWAGLWAAVSPHKGHKGHKPAAGKPQASCRETTRATSQLRGPGPAAVVNRGHPPANVTE